MDKLFLTPFLAGLAITLLLPLWGNLLRLRDEWLATLGLAHLATATALGGLAFGLPTLLGAPLGALLGALFKQLTGQRGHAIWGLIILAGWSAGLLIAANTTLGEALAHAVVDGQLWFAGPRELYAVLSGLTFTWPLLRWLTPHLIAARFFPERETANRLPAWRWHLVFELWVALAIALATTTVGLLATFALILVPSHLAFRLAAHWRQANSLAMLFAVASYLAAFVLALEFDQPFGPTLAAVLLLLLVVVGILRPAAAKDRITDAS